LIVPIGPFKFTIFPYTFHFSAINNHLLLKDELNGSLVEDEKKVYQALKNGNSFIGYDLPASTKGFSFSVAEGAKSVSMGESISIEQGATIRVKLPQKTEIRLICNGNVLYESHNADLLAFPITEPGAYRVECYIKFLGKRRGWIFSNPIYVSKG